MKSFLDATAVAVRDETYQATLDAQWSVGGRLHGGYLLAVLGRAACLHAGQDHPHLTAISGSFVQSPVAGPAEVLVEVLRHGRGLTQVHARLSQDGATCVEALITLGVLVESDSWWTAAPPVDISDEQDCVPTAPQSPGGDFAVPLMEVVEQRLDPRHLGFVEGAPSGKGVIAGWQRLTDGSDWDPLALLVALDPVPPVTYDLGLTGWVPTLQLSAYIRRLPAPGPIRFRMHAADVTGGRIDETAHIWDAKGRLVAQATQFAAVRHPD